MKTRPQFQLRFYDESQFSGAHAAAREAGLSTNEWICQLVDAELERVVKSKQKVSRG